MEPFSDSKLSDLADLDDKEYGPELEEMVGVEEIGREEELKPETDVNAGAGKLDDAGEDNEGAIAEDNEPVTESEKVSRVYIDGERKSRWCTENKLATS